MDSILVTGNGVCMAIPIAGQKMPANLDASHLAKRRADLTNAPRLSESQRCHLCCARSGRSLQHVTGSGIIFHQIENLTADYDLKNARVRLVLGPLLARFGQAVVSLPGAARSRASDGLHINALKRWAPHRVEEGYLHAKAFIEACAGRGIVAVCLG